MPAAGGLIKAELDISSSPQRPPIIRGSQISPYFRPVSPLFKCGSYVALWKNPQLSAYTFIWLNLCILCNSLLGLTIPLTSTLVLGLLTFNLMMAEHVLTGSKVTCYVLYGALGITEHELMTLPGSDEVCESVVGMFNSVAGVFLNIRDTSTQGKTQFYFALCTTVAMVTIVLSYLASTTTLLLAFWGMFCLPAIKYNELHKKVTKEEIVGVFNMSLSMLYNLYTALTAPPPARPLPANTATLEEVDGDIALDGADLDQTTSATLRTFSYLRGLPSTLTWGGGGGGTISRWWYGASVPPTAISPITESTESDSDYGIDDLPPEMPQSQLSLSGGDVSIDRGDDTLAEGLDPALLFDENQSTMDTHGGGFTLGSMATDGGTLATDAGLFTLGSSQSQHLLDAAVEEDEDESVEEDGRGPRVIRSSHSHQDDTLERSRPFMMDPSPPSGPRPVMTSPARPIRTAQQSEESENFYVISDEDILAASVEEEQSSLASSPGGNPMV